MSSARTQSTKKRIERLSWMLDNAVPVPGLNTRIGLDGIIGMIPVVGDGVTTLLSAYIMSEGVRAGVPKSVLLRMAFNTGVDLVIGMVPLVGDLFDFAWKSNRMNVKLIEGHLDRPTQTRRGSRWMLALLMIALLAVVVLAVWLVVMLIGAIWSALF